VDCIDIEIGDYQVDKNGLHAADYLSANFEVDASEIASCDHLKVKRDVCWVLLGVLRCLHGIHKRSIQS
jgi:hypothetical protein